MKQLLFTDKIFISDIENLTTQNYEIVKRRNNSDNKNQTLQFLFAKIDEFARQVVLDIDIDFRQKLLATNNLRVIMSKREIVQLIEETVNVGGKKLRFENPENVEYAFNFYKPENLLPSFSKKFKLIPQHLINDAGEKEQFFFNPLFFGVKLSYDIILTTIYLGIQEKEIVAILIDKYGEHFESLYVYVRDRMRIGVEKQHGHPEIKSNEYINSEVQKICGINTLSFVKNYFHDSCVSKISEYKEILAKYPITIKAKIEPDTFINDLRNSMKSYMQIYGQKECEGIINTLKKSTKFKENLDIASKNGHVFGSDTIQKIIYSTSIKFALSNRRKVYYASLYFLASCHGSFVASNQVINIARFKEVINDLNTLYKEIRRVGF